LFCVAAHADTIQDNSQAVIPSSPVTPSAPQDQYEIIDDDIHLPSGPIILEDIESPSAVTQDASENPQESQAAPLPPTNDLWQRIRDGYGMANLDSPYTATHEAWYAARPEYVQRMVSRSQLYLYHVVEEVQKRGMPTEIALLPMVESAFNPEAYSRSKASGIWQFIPSTGKHFGLKQDWWADNRRDVMAATDAALTYLNKLHVMFGTWELALAAYNAGEGTVQHAIDVNRRKGLPTDYQSLNLPEETREYVPKLQAVKNIISNPQQYGLDIKTIANQPYFTQVAVPHRIDVSLAARLAGVSMEEFSQLNPAHRRPVLMGESGKQSILLPIDKQDTFETNLANYNRPLVSWQTLYARRGERLSSVAKRYGVSIALLQESNDISAHKRLQSDQPLLIPASYGNQAVADAGNQGTNNAANSTEKPGLEQKSTEKSTAKSYVVKKGDTVISIAKNHGISTRQLLAFNHLKTSKLHNGQVLTINQTVTGKIARNSTPGKLTKSAGRLDKTRYIVKRGETLASIARKFNVATGDLQRWNKITGSHIIPGHTLTIYRPDAA
jgi:membrane-bound lytic murein transglycosylase D